MTKLPYNKLLLGTILALMSCKSSATDPTTPINPEKKEGVSGVRIAWDYSSTKRLATTGGYARVIRAQDGTLFCVYEDRRGNSMLIRSSDNGLTWSAPLAVFNKFTATKEGKSTEVNVANPEIYQLKDGSLIMGVNYRPAVAEIYPFAIAISRSIDNGYTWSQPEVIYEAAPRFTDGCWEPAFLQLPNGTLQVYFDHENRYQKSEEQEISMLVSLDNGKTWSKETTKVCFRANRRDGMPVPVISGDEILVSIEDNKIDQFKPYIVRTKIVDCWKTPVLGDAAERNYALKEPLADNVYAGAPYLAKLPSGEFVISYQTTEKRSSDWEKSTMEVAVGDRQCKNFTKRTRPFDVPFDKEAKWNSVALFDAQNILAVASSNFDGGDVGVWIKKGRIIPELQATKATISIDGNLSEGEWGAAFPIFIGSKGVTNSETAIRFDDNALYLATRVADATPFVDKLAADGVAYYIDAKNSSYGSLTGDCFMVKVLRNGGVMFYSGENGRWSEVAAESLSTVVKQNEKGYTVEVRVPFSALAAKAQPMRINVGMYDYASSYSGFEEVVANSSAIEPNTWCELNFK